MWRDPQPFAPRTARANVAPHRAFPSSLATPPKRRSAGKWLLDIRDEQGLGDAEIRIATKPSRPVQSALIGVAMTVELHLEMAENVDDWPDDLPRTVWLCAGDPCEEPDAPREAYHIASYVSGGGREAL